MQRRDKLVLSFQVIQSIGRSLTEILPKMVGMRMDEYFDVVRPLIEFK